MTMAPPLFGRLHLAWNDEFDGVAGAPPAPDRWEFDLGAGGWGNDELQAYTSSTGNASLDGNGHLRVVARRENSGGAAYTSARL